VLSDIKLAADEPGDTDVIVIQRLGCPDERIFRVAWADLDRDVRADHLTSIYIPRLRAPVAAELMRFHELVDTLRRECPWDREQTHASLRRHLVEEAYEVLDAIDGFDPESGDGADHLEEELGDLLFQVVLHSVIAAEEGWFDLADVARTVHDKLHARHPHVFGDATVTSTDDLVVAWEAGKVAEKGRSSVLDGIATGLPSLALAEKHIKKGAAIGSGVGDDELARLAARIEAAVADPSDDTVGAALMSLVALGRSAGVDPEMALRGHIATVAARVRDHERRSPG
jgi:tetrapyrrole methylase family protein/MazG family protein